MPSQKSRRAARWALWLARPGSTSGRDAGVGIVQGHGTAVAQRGPECGRWRPHTLVILSNPGSRRIPSPKVGKQERAYKDYFPEEKNCTPVEVRHHPCRFALCLYV